jgi:hypothetical protein
MMPHTLNTFRRTTVSDGGGSFSETYAANLTGVRCSIQESGEAINQEAGARRRATAWDIWVDTGADINVGDRIADPEGSTTYAEITAVEDQAGRGLVTRLNAVLLQGVQP